MGLGDKKIGQAQVPVPSMKEAHAQVSAPKGPEAAPVDVSHTFKLSYTDRRGHLWEGQFTTHVLAVKEHIQVGLIKARMAGGIPLDAIDPFTSNLLEMMAHLAVSLDDAPDWYANIEDIREQGVLEAVYTEVADHARRFHQTD